MTKKEARKRAIRLKAKWEDIVTDAIQKEYLVDDICLGCGERDCGGCPAGTSIGWNPEIRFVKL